MFFELSATDNRARAGVIHTDHGDIPTPIFMPVGTQATVKTLDGRDLKECGAAIILGNTYHLHLRPGEDLIAELGGLHKFMNYTGPLLTDSGGFQVFSLATNTNKQRVKPNDTAHNNVACLVKIKNDGVTFRSHLDGSTHHFTPESAIAIQQKIGADIIMAFDVCTPDTADHNTARTAMELTHRWAERCLVAHTQTGPHPWQQFLFGIIQGANHRDLREISARAITAMPFDGIAIGGESIGYNMSATATTLDWLGDLLPADKPRYSMGVGYSPRDLFTVIERGIDMFDCVAPTRIARNGTLYCRAASDLKINIRNAIHTRSPQPIDDWCDCFTCHNHSRAYLHHLFQAEEMLAYRLASLHNIRFLLKLCAEIRVAIQQQQFAKYKSGWFL